MRTNKELITVKYNKSDRMVAGYYPNSILYPNEDFQDNNAFGYIEISQDSWINRPKQAMVSDDYSGIEEKIVNNEDKINEIKVIRVSQIKYEAGLRILSSYPDHKQRNLNGAVSIVQNKELLALKAGSGNYTPTEEEMVLLRAAKACKEFIDAIRAKSNELEASLDSMTEEQLNAFDPSEDSNWE